MAHAYLDESLAELPAGAEHTVRGDEAHHAVKVARLAVGERVVLGNGAGLRVECEVTAVAPGAFTVRALADGETEPAPTPAIVLAQALAKSGRDELAVQTAVELGIDGVVPWQGRRSVSQWRGDKIEKHRTRWQQIAREATKQSMRARLPQVAPLATAGTLAEAVPGATLLVLDPRAETSLLELPLDGLGESIVLVVGPEGGIDPGELDALVADGAVPVRLGANVLRTSSAGPAALALLLTRLGRW